MWGCPVRQGMLSISPGLCPLAPPPPRIVTAESVSRYCQLLPRVVRISAIESMTVPFSSALRLIAWSCRIFLSWATQVARVFRVKPESEDAGFWSSRRGREAQPAPAGQETAEAPPPTSPCSPAPLGLLGLAPQAPELV